MAKRRRKDAEPTFESSLERLEEIVGRLEDGDLGLDESLGLFEEGVRLSRFCQARLTEVEQKVERILEDDDGGFRTEPLGVRESDPTDDDDEDDEDGDDGDEHDVPF